MKNLILIDWFAMSWRKKGATYNDVINALNLPEKCVFREMGGRYCYRSRLSCGNISVYYNNINPDNDYPMLEMSGQGCREFETFSDITFNELFELAKDTENYHLTRLDIAYDDFTGIFDINTISNDFRARNWVSNCTRGRFTHDLGFEFDGFSIMTGTKYSDIYMRIYDKAIERGFYDGRHWIRCELVLKQDRAVQFVLNKESIGTKYRGVIRDYFRFVTPSKKDTNKRRWKIRDYWERFLDDSERIKLFTKKDIEYNFSRLDAYVLGQAGNSIDTYIRCVGLPKFLDRLLKRDSRLTAKQKWLIEQCKLFVDKGVAVDEELLEEIAQSYEASAEDTFT